MLCSRPAESGCALFKAVVFVRAQQCFMGENSHLFPNIQCSPNSQTFLRVLRTCPAEAALSVALMKSLKNLLKLHVDVVHQLPVSNLHIFCPTLRTKHFLHGVFVAFK